MKRIFRKLIVFFISLILLVVTIVFASGYSVYKDVKVTVGPLKEEIDKIRTSSNYVQSDEISKDFLEAVVAIEDIRFYKHGAIELRSLTRAMLKNIKEKELLEGGSTITQQVVKNIYFDNDATLSRKAAEMIIGYDLEKICSKDEILELYVNIIYYGDDNYGIKEASENYFNKEPKYLDYDESTLLAGLPQSPSIYALSTGYEYAKERQEQVIEALEKYRN